MAFGKRIKLARTPKADLVKEMAQIFGVSPRAINVPNIDSYLGLMHTLFALEDMYGIKIGEIDGELCLRLDREHKEYQHLFEPFHAWKQVAAKLESGEISQEKYDNWRYNYPELDTSKIRTKVPSQEVSEKTLLTTLSNFGNSSSVRFLCYRNIILFNGYCKNVAIPLQKNNGICLEPA